MEEVQQHLPGGHLPGRIAYSVEATHDQCTAGNICALLLVLAAHCASMVLFRESRRGYAACWLIIAAAVFNVRYRSIESLTLMHQIMGMMGAEAAARVMANPLICASSRLDFIAACLVWLPNFLIVLGETVFAIRNTSGGFMGFTIIWHDFYYFARVPFYKKQHAILHATLCLLCMSVASSFWTRCRKSPRMQQGRMFVEPACLVAVAMILMTHHHGAGKPELATHPVIGSLMCLAAIFQLRCSALHMETPAADGSPRDLTAPIPGGGSPALRSSRLVAAYAYLVLAFFLYADTFMEYLGCRSLRGIEGPPDVSGPPELGLTPDTEVATYLSFAVMGAAIGLGCFIVRGVGTKSPPMQTSNSDADLHLQALLISEHRTSCGSPTNGFSSKDDVGGRVCPAPMPDVP